MRPGIRLFQGGLLPEIGRRALPEPLYNLKVVSPMDLNLSASVRIEAVVA